MLFGLGPLVGRFSPEVVALVYFALVGILSALALMFDDRFRSKVQLDDWKRSELPTYLLYRIGSWALVATLFGACGLSATSLPYILGMTKH